MSNTNPSPSTDLAWAESASKAYANKHVATWTGAAKKAVAKGYVQGARDSRAYEAKRAEGLIAIVELALEGDGETWDRRNRDKLEAALSTYRNGAAK